MTKFFLFFRQPDEKDRGEKKESTQKFAVPRKISSPVKWSDFSIDMIFCYRHGDNTNSQPYRHDGRGDNPGRNLNRAHLEAVDTCLRKLCFFWRQCGSS